MSGASADAVGDCIIARVLWVHNALVGKPVRRFDLALAIRCRAAGQIDVVVAWNGDRNDGTIPGWHVHHDEHVRVIVAGTLVAGVHRVEDVLRQGLALLVAAAIQPHDEDVLIDPD